MKKNIWVLALFLFSFLLGNFCYAVNCSWPAVPLCEVITNLDDFPNYYAIVISKDGSKTLIQQNKCINWAWEVFLIPKNIRIASIKSTYNKKMQTIEISNKDEIWSIWIWHAVGTIDWCNMKKWEESFLKNKIYRDYKGFLHLKTTYHGTKIDPKYLTNYVKTNHSWYTTLYVSSAIILLILIEWYFIKKRLKTN